MCLAQWVENDPRPMYSQEHTNMTLLTSDCFYRKRYRVDFKCLMCWPSTCAETEYCDPSNKIVPQMTWSQTEEYAVLYNTIQKISIVHQNGDRYNTIK